MYGYICHRIAGTEKTHGNGGGVGKPVGQQVEEFTEFAWGTNSEKSVSKPFFKSGRIRRRK